MKLGKHAVKVLAVFAVLFVVGFALKFLNLHEGFYNRGEGKRLLASAAQEYTKRRQFMKNARNAANNAGLEKPGVFTPFPI